MAPAASAPAPVAPAPAPVASGVPAAAPADAGRPADPGTSRAPGTSRRPPAPAPQAPPAASSAPALAAHPGPSRTRGPARPAGPSGLRCRWWLRWLRRVGESGGLARGGAVPPPDAPPADRGSACPGRHPGPCGRPRRGDGRQRPGDQQPLAGHPGRHQARAPGGLDAAQQRLGVLAGRQHPHPPVRPGRRRQGFHQQRLRRRPAAGAVRSVRPERQDQGAVGQRPGPRLGWRPVPAGRGAVPPGRRWGPARIRGRLGVARVSRPGDPESGPPRGPGPPGRPGPRPWSGSIWRPGPSLRAGPPVRGRRAVRAGPSVRAGPRASSSRRPGRMARCGRSPGPAQRR